MQRKEARVQKLENESSAKNTQITKKYEDAPALVRGRKKKTICTVAYKWDRTTTKAHKTCT